MIVHVTDRQDFLQAELKKINRKLPAAVYIPFVNDSMRNYSILHIVGDEAKVFQTKERAPLLIHLEAYRPEELMLTAVERPLRKPKNKVKAGGYFNSAAELEYENYRSSSWDSSQRLSDKELAKLREPLVTKRSMGVGINPYMVEKQERYGKK